MSLRTYATILFILGLSERLGELADIRSDRVGLELRRCGAAPKSDMHLLWRRIVFNVLISNTDDHLRNHGFLYDGPVGWRDRARQVGLPFPDPKRREEYSVSG